METKYTEKELVSFGNYLLSPHRIQSLMEHPDFEEELLAERLEQVSDADLENWKLTRKEYCVDCSDSSDSSDSDSEDFIL